MEVLWNNLRSLRNMRLIETDKTQLPDFPLDTKTRGLYKDYRKYLRNLPSMYTDNTIGTAQVLDFNSWKSFTHNVPKEVVTVNHSVKFIMYRTIRDKYLKQSDWTQLADVSLSYEEKQSWRSYRDYLRASPKLWNDQNIADNEPAKYEEWKNGKV